MRSIWHTLPARSFTILLLAIFLTFVPMGFLVDVSILGANPPAHLFAFCAFSGCMAVGYFTAIRIRRRVLPFVIAVQVGSFTLFNRLLLAPTGALNGDALRARLTFDAVATGVAIAVAYILFMAFFRREGARYFRAHAEIELAHVIHKLLVPRVDARVGRFTFCGASLPSGEVGGDLVDLVEVDGRWVGYIADVSGHGVGAGVMMAMVKSAARMKLLTPAPVTTLLDDLNEALVPLREPGMFVTMSCLRYEEGSGLTFSLAGHLPILHYQAATGTVEERSISHFPVAMFEGTRFSEAPMPCEAGDLFVLVTDGLTEVCDAGDGQLGLESFKDVIRRGALRPLDALLDTIVATARAHGTQTDDQTVLLVRCG
jgi:serine phosphatase RsbU (regulator of sigma subunit)